MKRLTDHYLTRERELARERQTELSYALMQAVARELDGRADWTLARLADEIGAPLEHVGRWLNGTAYLSFSTVARIEKALGTPLVEVGGAGSAAFAKRGMPRRPSSA